MLLILVILLLVSSLVTGVYFTMNKSTPVQVSSISPESKLDLKVPPTSPVVKPPLQAMIPVDCVGKWGPWSKCSAGCSEDDKQPDGSQKRDWITLRKAENGGKACVYDVNKDGFKVCKGSTGSWTGWSGCSRRCGTGSSTRKFIVKTKGDDGGSTCPGGANGKTGSRKCNTHGCPSKFIHKGHDLCGRWEDTRGNCDNECWRRGWCKAYMRTGGLCRMYDNSGNCGPAPGGWSGAKVRNPNYYAP